MGILISDVDGTLKHGGAAADTIFKVSETAEGKKQLSIVSKTMDLRTQERIRYLQRREKLQFGLCSSWPLHDLLAFFPEADFYIAEEGAIVHFGGEDGETVRIFAENEEFITAGERLKRLKRRLCSELDAVSDCYLLEREYSCLLVYINREPDSGVQKGLEMNQFGGLRRIEIDGILKIAELNFVEYRIPMITKERGVREVMRRLQTKRFCYYGNDCNDLSIFRLPGCVGFAPDSASREVLASVSHHTGSVSVGMDTVLDCIEFGMARSEEYVSNHQVKSLLIRKEKYLIEAAGKWVARLIPWMTGMRPIDYWHAIDTAIKAMDILSALREEQNYAAILAGTDCRDALVAAALLHDIEEFSDHPHEQAGAQKAQEILQDIGRGDIAEEVSGLILCHTDKKREWVDTSMLLANILIDADVISRYSLIGCLKGVLFQNPDLRLPYAEDCFHDIDTLVQEIRSTLHFAQSLILIDEGEMAYVYYMAGKILSGDFI